MIGRLSRHVRPFTVRDPSEAHRPATQLELLFDLVVVIALATAAHHLRHAISADHVGIGVFQFLVAFFLLWWPWNLFTFFASSFDNDDAYYRLNVMIMMVGAMVIAASLSKFFEHQDLRFTFVGYVILRLPSVALWLRAGRANPEYRVTARKHTAGLIVIQAVWAFIVFGTEPGSAIFYGLFVLGVIGELLLPWYSQHDDPTPLHRHHLIERFGLLNIIVLGEVLLSSTEAFELAFTGNQLESVVVAASGAVIAFAMWWLYFVDENHLGTLEIKRVFVWGYGHFLVFAAGASVGAGLGVVIDAMGAQDGHATSSISALSVSIPIALYIVGLWIVRDRYAIGDKHGWLLLAFAAVIAASGLLPYGPIPVALLLVACLLARLQSERRRASTTY